MILRNKVESILSMSGWEVGWLKKGPAIFGEGKASLVAQTSKDSACNPGGLGSVPGLGRSPGEGKGYPPQYSYLENSMDKGAWQVQRIL